MKRVIKFIDLFSGMGGIRLGFDQTDFRNIIRKPTNTNSDSSIFANEQIWRDFSDKHFEIVESIEEKSVDEILRQNPNSDLKRLLKARDNRWAELVQNSMIDNYNHSMDRLNNRAQAAEPQKLLQKAIDALTSIDTTQESFTENENSVHRLEQIIDIATQYIKQCNE